MDFIIPDVLQIVEVLNFTRLLLQPHQDCQHTKAAGDVYVVLDLLAKFAKFWHMGRLFQYYYCHHRYENQKALTALLPSPYRGSIAEEINLRVLQSVAQTTIYCSASIKPITLLLSDKGFRGICCFTTRLWSNLYSPQVNSFYIQ